MRSDLAQWMKDDPITTEQVEVLHDILGDKVTEEALEGFLVVCSRLVNEFGEHRTAELRDIFKTDTATGREAFRVSLEHICRWVKGLTGYITDYPVKIIPPKPAFPLFKVINIHKVTDRVYRVFSSQSSFTVRGKKEFVKDFVTRTGKLPPVPIQIHPVRRTKPTFHWCSYESWPDPETTRNALQILPEWSDCKLRAVLPTFEIRYSAYVAFSGDKQDPADERRRFYKYFFEINTQDHPSLAGGGLQIGVEGSPPVDLLEEWDDTTQKWKLTWEKSSA
jgi:hypothetical protein